MKKWIWIGIVVLVFASVMIFKDELQAWVDEGKEPTTEVTKNAEPEKQDPAEEGTNFEAEAEANAEEYPAKPGAMLYDKNEEKFEGMNYYFKGTLVKIERVEGLFNKMEDAFLVKNEQGYVMPIFPPYEIDVAEGDEIEVWGPLSGDGYDSSDLGVDNVVGVTGAMNATRIDINGETK